MPLTKVGLGDVKFVEDKDEFKEAFARFEGDELNGWSQEKEKRRTQKATVRNVYEDSTVTASFADGKTLNFPFEAIFEQLSITETKELKTGVVKFVQDAQEFKKAFSRFEGDKLNGWSKEKEDRRVQKATVTTVFKDQTVTARFDDGKTFDFPFEAIAEQISVHVVERKSIKTGDAVKLIQDQEDFKKAFARFEGDETNGWSTEKEDRRTQSPTVTEVYGDDTVTVRFADGEEFDFPFEAIVCEQPGAVPEKRLERI